MELHALGPHNINSSLAQLVETCHLKVPWFKSRLRRSSFSNFPSLMVDYYVQLGNLLLLITSPILI